MLVVSEPPVGLGNGLVRPLVTCAQFNLRLAQLDRIAHAETTSCHHRLQWYPPQLKFGRGNRPIALAALASPDGRG